MQPITEHQAKTERRAWVEHVMNTAVSVHVRGPRARDSDVDDEVTALFGALHQYEAMFSVFREDSQIRMLQRGEITLADADPYVREVHRLCEAARILTGGWFDAWSAAQRAGANAPRGEPIDPGTLSAFNPTGLVKTWAVARASARIQEMPGISVAVGAGGDIALSSTDDAPPWTIGIEDPHDPARILATVAVRNGGIATSGLAARGAHIMSPRTGRPATEVQSATVIGPSLMWADVWATAAVARGATAPDWAGTLEDTSGIIVMADKTVHRWGTSPDT